MVFSHINLHNFSISTLVKTSLTNLMGLKRPFGLFIYIHNVVFLLVLWFDTTHTHTHKHTQHTQGPVDWHTCIIIYWHHLLFAQSNYLYYIKWLNESFTDIRNLLYICWLDAIRLDSFCETQIILTEMV